MAPPAIKATPRQFTPERLSPRNIAPKNATSTTLSLSIGATSAASPIWSDGVYPSAIKLLAG
jgi:hypothetical protein